PTQHRPLGQYPASRQNGPEARPWVLETGGLTLVSLSLRALGFWGGGILFAASLLDELAQPPKRVIPLLGNHGEILSCFFQPSLLQLPDSFAPALPAAH